MGAPKRIVLLVTSPRLPAGLLTAAAWDAVRANPVFAETDSELTVAVRAAGGKVTLHPQPATAALLAAAQPVAVWLSGPAGDQDLARELGMRLAREPGLAELELMYGSWDPPGARLLDAVAVTERLSEDPWRREQTHRTLAKYVLEEAYEAYDAILAGDYAAIRDEMGDVLAQVMLHARMAEDLPEDQRWTVDDVAADYVAKMIRRNPHLFDGPPASDVEEVLANWERIKQAEKPQQSLADSITWTLPALILAPKLLAKARRGGLADPQPDDSLGSRLLQLIAAEPNADPEAALREALRSYLRGHM